MIISQEDSSMSNFNFDSYCGLYCGACDILQAYRKGLETGKTPGWDDVPERMRKNLPFHPKEIKCHGCKTDTVFGGCAYCPIRKCARKKGNVEHCWDCKKYPCFRFKLMSIIAKLSSLDKKLPHQKTKKANQACICEFGTAQWLAVQDNKWKCPGCGTTFSWYRETCEKCGRELDSLKGYM